MSSSCAVDLYREGGRLYARLTFDVDGAPLIVNRAVIKANGVGQTRLYMPSNRDATGMRHPLIYLPPPLYATALAAIRSAVESGR